MKAAIMIDEDRPLSRHPPRRNALLRRRKVQQLIILSSILLFILGIDFLSTALSEIKYRIKPVTPPIQLPDSVKHSWAQYTPYYSSSEYTVPPHHCKITQVNILQRHGARFPASNNENEGEKIRAAISTLKSATEYLDPRLEFLSSYIYDLGDDDLVAFGAAQSFDSGQFDYARYKNLVNKKSLPFVRASGDARVIDSATNWTAGFAHASHGKVVPSLDLAIEESDGSNNTLNNGMCPNAGGSEKQTSIWESIYASGIAARLSASAPGANLTVTDVTSLISLCALETVAKINPSDFCGIFDQSEFEDFEYYGDLNKYYGTGYGQELGPVQGVGYINELIARLTDSSVRDNTQTNRTLDSSNQTFPLFRPIYTDFTHENEMVAIYSALGLFRQPRNLDPEEEDKGRTWIASRMVPFTARLVVERMECEERDGKEMTRKSMKKAREKAVRVLVNDRVQRMEFCGSSEDDVCSLDSFLESQDYARNDGRGDFEKCFM